MDCMFAMYMLTQLFVVFSEPVLLNTIAAEILVQWPECVCACVCVSVVNAWVYVCYVDRNLGTGLDDVEVAGVLP